MLVFGAGVRWQSQTQTGVALVVHKAELNRAVTGVNVGMVIRQLETEMARDVGFDVVEYLSMLERLSVFSRPRLCEGKQALGHLGGGRGTHRTRPAIPGGPLAWSPQTPPGARGRPAGCAWPCRQDSHGRVWVQMYVLCMASHHAPRQ